MALTLDNITFYRTESVTDGDTNGGRMLETAEVVTGVKYNLFPRVTYDERTAGVTRYRKEWMANTSPDEAAYGALFCITVPSNGGDRFYLKAGSDTDVQSDLAADGWVGGGQLASAIAAGDSVVQISFEAADYTVADGCLICITDSSNTVWVRATDDGTPAATWAGNVATVRLAEQVAHSFASSGSYAGVCLELGDLTPSVDTVATVSASGVFDETAMQFDNRGAVHDEWTITFTGSTSFTVVGGYEGVLETGSTNQPYAPVNPRTGYPFFTLPVEAFSGAWVSGDTVSFTTRPAAKSIWWKEVVPAGTEREASNTVTARWFVE